MGRVLGFALMSVFFSVTLMAAQRSRTPHLGTAGRAGRVQLPRGICEVTWEAASRSRVRLSIKTEDRTTVTVPARGIEGNQHRTGVATSVVNGIPYLEELYTPNAKFIL